MKRRVLIALGVAAALIIVYLVARGRAVPVEMAQVVTQNVREYVSEDAKTYLEVEYVVSMPVSGTLERVTLEVCDEVEQGQCVARVDPLSLEQQVRGVEALMKQALAQIEGVDATKPKAEDVKSASLKAHEAQDGERIAQEERAVAETQYAEAETDYARMSALHDANAVSEAEYDKAKRNYEAAGHNRERAVLAEQAARRQREVAELNAQRVCGSIQDNEYLRKAYEAEIERLTTDMEVLKDDLRKTDMLSPVSGPVLEKYEVDERYLPAGTPVLKIGDPASIRVQCDVLSEEVGRIQAGNAVEISGKSLQNRVIEGKVMRIHPSGFKKISSLGVEQQRVRTVIAFDNGEAALRPGTSVDVKIITAEHKGALAVPERATFRREGQWMVFLVRRGRACLTPVTLGLKNDDWAEVLNGLSLGQTIVAEPKNEIDDRTRVTSY